MKFASDQPSLFRPKVALSLTLALACWASTAIEFGSICMAQGGKASGVGIVAVVEGAPITRYELDKALNLELAGLREQYPQQVIEERMHELRSSVLRDLIMRQLLLQRCDKEQIAVDESQINRHIDNSIREYQNQGQKISTRAEYYKLFKEETGYSEKEVRSFLGENIRIGRLYHSKVYHDVFVSPQELRAFFEKHRNEFSTEAKYHFRMILLWNNNPDQQRMIAALQKELEEGKASFEDLVLKYSEGPFKDQGGLYVHNTKELSEFLPPIPRVVQELQVGQTSPLVRSAKALHFIYLEKKEAGKVQSFEKAQAQIRQGILRQRRNQQRERYERDLQDRADVRIFLPLPKKNKRG